MNEESIFIEALHQAPESLAAFLDEACDGQSELRRGVESLLRAHERAGHFLQRNLFAVSATEETPISEGPGTVIGGYKLLEQIDEGGFGTVFMADQEKPLRRRVALKIIKPGMDTKHVVARFEAERQALALMEHPNIAQVFDGGETASGRPYFVMELVRGISITEYCDQNQLSSHERLKLFVSVCQAVQHAHQKGIIHRDLKPSNILVTLIDGIPIVKIIDFGIVKSTGGQLTSKTLFTSFAHMIGTPTYMSPEQVQMSGQDIDTRSDIYSLGVLLYELLTGMTPLDKSMLQTAGYDEVRRIIREEEPVRPSSKISTLAKASTTVFANRKNDPVQSSRLFRAELDWIVMKCLDKNRERRYQTANELVQDIERYLDDEPLQACPPSRWYRFTKFAKRNKARLLTGVLVVLFICGLGGSLAWRIYDRAAREANIKAMVQPLIAETLALQQKSKWREAELVAQRAEDLLAGGNGASTLHQKVQELLADLRMGSKLEEVRLLGSGLKNDHFDNDSVDRGYASAFHDYGIDVENLDLTEAAKRIQTRTIRVELTMALEGWAGTRRRIPQYGRRSWQDLLKLANEADLDPSRTAFRDAVLRKDRQALVHRASTEESRELPPGTLVLLAEHLAEMDGFEEATALLRRAQEQHPGDFWINHQLAHCLAGTSPPQWDEAIRFYSTAVAIRPESPGARLNLGTAFSGKGRLDEAMAAYRRVIELKPDYAEAYCNLGLDLARKGRLDEALTAINHSLRLQPRLAPGHGNLGLVLRKKGLVDEAITAYRRAIDLQPGVAVFHCGLGDALIAKSQFDRAIDSLLKATKLKPEFADAHNLMGLALWSKGQFDEAIAACSHAIKIKPDLAEAHLNLGLAYVGKNRDDDALASYRQAILVKPDYAQAHNNIAIVLQKRGQLDEAIAVYRQAIHLKPDLVTAHHNLGRALVDKGRFEEATAAYQRVLDLTPHDALAHYDFANVLSDQGRVAEAIAAYRRSIALKPEYAESHCNLATILQSQGEFAQALVEFKRGHELGSRRPNWRYPSARWLEDCQRMCDLEERLPAFLRGEIRPVNSAERTGLPLLCYYKKRYATAARMWLDAFRADPQLADDLEAGYRYQAACAASLAASGTGVAADQIDDKERQQWRIQALDWLRADLALNVKLLTTDKQNDRQQALRRLRHWKRDSDLAGLRDQAELAKLTEKERANCQEFWRELETQLTKAQADDATPQHAQ